MMYWVGATGIKTSLTSFELWQWSSIWVRLMKFNLSKAICKLFHSKDKGRAGWSYLYGPLKIQTVIVCSNFMFTKQVTFYDPNQPPFLHSWKAHPQLATKYLHFNLEITNFYSLKTRSSLMSRMTNQAPAGKVQMRMWRSKKKDTQVVGWCSDTEAMIGMWILA